MPDSEQVELSDDSVLEERSRATPLKPTVWMTGVLVWATVVGLFLRIPAWAGIFLCVLTGFSFLLYIGSYIYLMATDRESLRAERYSMKLPPPSQRNMQMQIHRESLEADQDSPAHLEMAQEKSRGAK